MSDYKEAIYDLANSAWMKFGDVKVLSEKSLNYTEPKLKPKYLSSIKNKPRNFPRPDQNSPDVPLCNSPAFKENRVLENEPSAIVSQCNYRNTSPRVNPVSSVETKLTNLLDSPKTEHGRPRSYEENLDEIRFHDSSELPFDPEENLLNKPDPFYSKELAQTFVLSLPTDGPSQAIFPYSEIPPVKSPSLSQAILPGVDSPPRSSCASLFSPLYVSPRSKTPSPSARSELPSIGEFGKIVNPSFNSVTSLQSRMCNANEEQVSPRLTQWLEGWSCISKPEDDYLPLHPTSNNSSQSTGSDFSLFQNPIENPDSPSTAPNQDLRCKKGGEGRENGTYSLFSENGNKPFGAFSVSVINSIFGFGSGSSSITLPITSYLIL